MNQKMLIENGYIDVALNATEKTYAELKADEKNFKQVNTILSNIASYGYALNPTATFSLFSMNEKELKGFWKNTHAALEEITGANRKMGEYVVYKNFPKEVLSMSQSEYWFKQILMYMGVDKEYLVEEKEQREPLNEKISLKVLQPKTENTIAQIKDNLIKQKVSWSDNQQAHIKAIFDMGNGFMIDFKDFGFKKNAVELTKHAFNSLGDNITTDKFNITSATDVLRVCASLSESDVSLKKVEFSKVISKRKNRKLFLALLENTSNLFEDIALRPQLFKNLFKHLHPGDYKFANVKLAYDMLYKDEALSFNQKLNSVKQSSFEYLGLLQTRPGEFLRGFHKAYSLFPKETVEAFEQVMPELSTFQLVSFEKYINTINDRKHLIAKPNASWQKAKVLENKKVKISQEDLSSLNESIHQVVSQRLNTLFPEGVNLDEKTKFIKLPSNDQKVAPYGRGTKFFIDKENTFARTSSYWKHGQTMFMDNGWNFFDAKFEKSATTCWNSTAQDFALFSGDPINSSNKDFAGCQLIDIDFNKMKEDGFKYGVWNILSYNRLKFNECDSHAALQYGKNAMSGELFEPSRVDISFPLKGEELTKFVTLLDVEEKTMTYLDFSFGNDVSSAVNNESKLMTLLPALLESLEAIPSVHDLFKHANKGATKVLYDDASVEIKDEKAYVFLPKNKANTFEKISLESVLEYQEHTKKMKNKM